MGMVVVIITLMMIGDEFVYVTSLDNSIQQILLLNLQAGDKRAVFVTSQPQKIPLHNFYEFIWLLKTGLPRCQ